MIILALQEIRKSFGTHEVLKGVSFTLQEQERMGLVGVNGCGKSTLMKIIAGAETADAGSVNIQKGLRIGYLAQQGELSGKETVQEVLERVFDPLVRMEEEMRSLETEMAEHGENAEMLRRLGGRYDALTREFERQNGYGWRSQVTGVLKGLKLWEMREMETGRLSGGERTRLCLGRLLLSEPDLLLLDEPTNHLDIESIQWLENFLGSYPGAVVLVSHDRTFLDNITRRTIEITAGRIYDYKCPYSEYVVQMQERRASQMAQLTTQQRQVAQIEAFIERFRYKATKSKQVQSRIKMLEKMETVKVDEVSTESIHFRFPPAPHSGKIVVEAQRLGKAYGELQVFDNVDFLLTSGSKVAFVGRNGEGKSTMAKIIVGEIKDYTGMFKLGAQVQLGYYAQNQAAMLDGEKTVFQTIDDIAVGDIRPKIRNILGSFLFDSEDCEKKVKVLSGGEKARLALAKLLLTPSNLLILDEPTNHLDMDSKDILKNALLQYTGTLILVSHDRDFLQGLTDTLYEFRDGAVHEFKGDIFEFLDWRQEEAVRNAAAKSENAKTSAGSTGQGRKAYEQSKDRERELRKLRGTVEKIEKEIERLEGLIAEKEAVLASGSAQDSGFYAEYQSLKDLLDQQMDAWEEATIAMDDFQEGRM